MVHLQSLLEGPKMKIVEYVFRKRDGSLRTLKGTQSFKEYAKTNPETWENIKPKGERKSAPYNITLIDIENKGWRSIRPDSLIARREVKVFDGGWHLHNYEKKKMSSISKMTRRRGSSIKRNSVPYYALMILNKDVIQRNDVEVIVEGIQEKLGRKLTVRNGHIRAFSRAFLKFRNNGLIEKLDNRKGEWYQITSKGKAFLESGVRV